MDVKWNVHNSHFFIKREMCNSQQSSLLLGRRNVNCYPISISLSKKKCSIARIAHSFLEGEMWPVHSFHFFVKAEMSNGTQCSLLLRRRDVKWHTISISLSQQRFQWQTKLAPSWKERCEVAHNFNFFIKAEMLNFTHCSLLLEGEMWTGTQFPFLYQSRDVQWQTILTPA